MSYLVKLADVAEIDRLNARVRLAVSKNTIGEEDVSQGLLRLEPGKAMDEHIHEKSVEIFFPIEGQCEIVINGESYYLEPGVIARVPKGVPHYLKNIYDKEFKVVFTHVPHV